MSRSARSGATPARSRATALVALLLVVTFAGCATLGMMESIDSLLAQGKELFQSGKYAEALAKFQAVISRDPKQWEAYLYTARTYIAQKSWGPAIDNARKALGLAPSQRSEERRVGKGGEHGGPGMID